MVTMTAAECLRELADRLKQHGLCARLDQPIGRPPTLHVSNPSAPGLEENIRLEDGALWWSWGDPVASTTEIDAATDSIRRVLGAHSTPSRIG
ncbi:hypothetical protein [Actinocorallia longicatena]|uniref:Uncharacterized protein n=1 Tax=Actinocorallia longicatena TaxID=111803 RepID=A0ABP6PYX6_9ACTN